MIKYFHWYNFTVHTMMHEHIETKQPREEVTYTMLTCTLYNL